MQYDLSIRNHNVQPHLDIEKDIKAHKDGLMTFTIRINNGNITDYNLMEVTNAREEYLSLKRITYSQYTIAHNNLKRG